jgi:hypothetical protein
MNTRMASLLAAVALAGLASPALAGDGPGDPPPLPDEQWEEEWYEEGYPEGPADTGVAWEHDGWHDPGLPPQPYADEARHAQDQRAAWLEQCRQTYYDDRGERRGEVIGGVIGGVGGAIIGNRILDGSRLGGTLIGGGVGALAGAAIGGEIGEDADRDRAARRIDECEDYLLRYERGYAAGPAYGAHGYGHGQGAYGYGAQGYGAWPPVMWVKVPIVTERRRVDCGCRKVVEEVVEEVIEEEVVAPPQKRVKIQRVAPAPTKVTKTTRYSK